MRGSIIARAGLIAMAVVGVAHGDTRTTTTVVTVRKKPGEKEIAVATLPVGTVVEVLREEGRWLWIRAKKIEGYVTRTTVSTTPQVGAGTAPTWSAPRRQDGVIVTALSVAITAPTGILRATPSATAATVVEVPRGGRLVQLDAAADPNWIHARDAQGHEGWIARADVADSGASAVTASTPTDDAPKFVRRAPRATGIRAELGLGFRSLGMDFSSNTQGGLRNFLVDADAAALSLDVQAMARHGGRWFIAVDARSQISDASPGIDYPGPTSAPGKIPFRTFAADVGVRGGLRVRQVFDLALRAGGHYDAFITRSVANAGALPRERLIGITIGVDAEIVPPRSPFSATLRFDALPLGARAQTPGLQDGTANTARALSGGLTVRYLLSARWTLFGGADFGRATTTWSGPSMREAGVTHAHRVDTTQSLQAGIGAEL